MGSRSELLFTSRSPHWVSIAAGNRSAAILEDLTSFSVSFLSRCLSAYVEFCFLHIMQLFIIFFPTVLEIVGCIVLYELQTDVRIFAN